MPDASRLMTRATHIFRSSPGLRLAYLFGSRASGAAGPSSDHDYAVLLDPGVDHERTRSELARQLAAALSSPRIDVVVLNGAPIELSYAVIAGGKVVFQRDTVTRVEYEAHVLGRYGDMLPMLRAQRADILRGGSDEPRVQRYRAALGRTERALGQIGAARGKAPTGGE